jgi:glyoxylase-like metal-dependent hydrolase (beta-lactamase superfamily II)
MSIPLPPVDEVVPGLWVVPVPIPVNPLRYVLVHAFETDGGLVLVDTGWDTPEAWEALGSALETIGGSTEAVRGVLVTHIHPDHYGLAGRLREVSGCWVGLHPADAALIDLRYVDVDELVEQTRRWMLDGGVPETTAEELATASLAVREYVNMAQPDVLVEDGDRPDVPGWEMVAVHTPGHSPGHLCFALPALDAVLTGDHVLPRITPNVSYHPQSGDDPLGDFLASLERLRPYASALGLPGHEWRFRDLGTRVDELIAHHERRLDEALGIVASGAETAWEVARSIRWSRPWDGITGFMRRMAVAEIHAHLIVLERRGLLERVGEGPSRWKTTAAGAER